MAVFSFIAVAKHRLVSGNVSENVSEDTMSNITFHVELDNYTKKDGTSNLQIRITQNRKLKRIKVGVAILPDQWNAEKSEVRRTNPQYRQINTLIRAKLLELEKMYLEDTIMARAVTPERLLVKLKRDVVGDSFLDYAEARIQKMVAASTRKGQSSVIKKLREYMGARDLFFIEVNYEFLINYERHLRRLKNGPNTIHANMKTIKAIYNEALNSGYFTPENGSPWKIYKPKKEKSKRSKLTEIQMLAFENAEVRPGINEWHSKNIFLLSFYFQGMRTADILQLRWGQIKEGRVEYTAEKTLKTRSKKIVAKAEAILALYRFDGLRSTDYVFPFLKGKNRKQFTDDQWLGVIASSNALINGHLKNIGERIGIKKISMHVARHSFADIAKRKTGNVYAVSDALGHSSVSVTENYFNAATNAENDDLVDSVFGSD